MEINEREVAGCRVDGCLFSFRRASEGSRTQHATRPAVCGYQAYEGSKRQQATRRAVHERPRSSCSRLVAVAVRDAVFPAVRSSAAATIRE